MGRWDGGIAGVGCVLGSGVGGVVGFWKRGVGGNGSVGVGGGGGGVGKMVCMYMGEESLGSWGCEALVW